MEILLALVQNVSCLTQVIAVFCGILGVVSWVFCKTEDIKTPVPRHLLIVAIIALPFAVFPTIEDLVKVRISLIKYHLAEASNIQGGIETIERIGKKLECKYLGCDEEKKESK